MNKLDEVIIVGAGLAGCEAALQLAKRGIKVKLFEMRPKVQTPVHKTGHVAELVCSNSFKSTNPDSAAGCLKAELKAMGSFLLEAAQSSAIPAGGALAVDRDVFSKHVQLMLDEHKNIQVVQEEIQELPQRACIIATGPLTSDALAHCIEKECGSQHLSFYDAAAPIIEAESIDREIVFAQSRYDKGESADYLNAPFDKKNYELFWHELINASRVIEKDFERRELFAACQPVEEVARSGLDALRFGALKPVGLTDPRTQKRPWAAVQLRAENADCSAYNLVGFQTNLLFGEQERVFRMIPGLENAIFSRFGVMHRNTFIDTPHCLTESLALPHKPYVHFAGQVTGTEGYMEAIASGLFVALCVYAELENLPACCLPEHTLFGSLLAYATNSQTQDYQPMHVNYGILEPVQPKIRNKAQRYAANAKRAQTELNAYIASRNDLFGN